MDGEITLKAPVALAFVAVLVVSLLVNVWALTRSQPVVIPAPPAGGGSAVGVPARLPTGEPDPLAHVPRHPQDAVGMPDATGGREVMGGP